MDNIITQKLYSVSKHPKNYKTLRNLQFFDAKLYGYKLDNNVI